MRAFIVMCRKHVAFKDIILRGEEGIEKRITDNPAKAKFFCIHVVNHRFFVVYEDPTWKPSELSKSFRTNKQTNKQNVNGKPAGLFLPEGPAPFARTPLLSKRP